MEDDLLFLGGTIVFKGEIISVGTELLLGQIANTNAQYISQRMAEIGVPIYFHIAVGDNSQRLKDVVINAQQRSNLIVFTGGLGPTEDDITKEVVAELLNLEMVLDEYTYQRIVDFFKQRKTNMTNNNKKQAMVLEGSEVFPNDHGLAAGIGIEDNKVYYIFLPGPPSEMKPMLDDYVIPWFKEKYQGNTFYSKVMRFTGIGEAALEETIIDLIKNQTNPTIAPLANEGEVTIRLTANAIDEKQAMSLIDPIEREIHKRLENYHYGYDKDRIEIIVFNMLKKLELTVSVSESVTGGLVGSQFTGIPGSSTVYHGGIICYDNKVKNQLLNIPMEVLQNEGAVSIETARLMALNTFELFKTDIAVSITGIAGPEAVEGKPVGLVYIGIHEKGKETLVKEINLSGDRNNIQTRASRYVHYLLWKRLKERLT